MLIEMWCPKDHSWLSIGGDDDSNSSFVVDSLITTESNLCSECGVTHWTCMYLQSESLVGEGDDRLFTEALV